VRAPPGLLIAGLAVLAVAPLLAGLLDQPFYIDLLRRVMIFAIAALSLNLILGYGGLVSFGHAAYLGLGAYAVGVLTHHGVENGFSHARRARSSLAWSNPFLSAIHCGSIPAT